MEKITGEVRAYDLRGSDGKNFRNIYAVAKKNAN